MIEIEQVFHQSDDCFKRIGKKAIQTPFQIDILNEGIAHERKNE